MKRENFINELSQNFIDPVNPDATKFEITMSYKDKITVGCSADGVVFFKQDFEAFDLFEWEESVSTIVLEFSGDDLQKVYTKYLSPTVSDAKCRLRVDENKLEKSSNPDKLLGDCLHLINFMSVNPSLIMNHYIEFHHSSPVCKVFDIDEMDKAWESF